MAQNYKLYRIIHPQAYLFMPDLKTLTIEELQQSIRNSSKIAIIPHKNPDGDAIGSSLGFWHYLRESNKDCTIVVNDAVPEFLNFLPDVKEITNFETDPEKSIQTIQEADIIFCLDYGQLYRTGNLQPHIESARGIKVMVDHHPSPDTNFNFMYHEIASSSTCELIYMLIKELTPNYPFSMNTSACLYTGLITDTGCFKHALRPETFRIAADLLSRGISYEYIVTNIYDVNTPEKLKLIGFALNEKLNVMKEYRTSIISISFEESEKLNLKKGDTEGLVNYALSIENMVVGAFFHEREKGKTKISLRSKGNFAVNSISEKYFSGGGHRNAAGGEFIGTAETAVAQFIDILPQYKAELMSLEIGKRD